MNIKIQDSLQQIKTVVEDLQAVQTVIMMAEDHPVYSNDHETLIVVRRALDPIMSDLEDAILAINEGLKDVQ